METFNLKAILLAGGEGTRLKPYTTILPKPLMPIGNIPILEVILNQLKFFNFNEIIIALGYKARYIKTFFGNGQDLGFNIEYSYEKKNLGTAGPLSLLKDLDDNFLVMNGDILTDLNYKKFFDKHLNSEAGITIAVHNKTINIDLGVIETEKNRVVDYIEKPAMSYQVSMGIYAFNKRVLDYIPYNQFLNFPDLIKKLLEENEIINTYTQPECIWLDIGRLEDFQRSLAIFEKNKSKFLPNMLNG
jgi:NDP-sugar pyrophosphorylase family protein